MSSHDESFGDSYNDDSKDGTLKMREVRCHASHIRCHLAPKKPSQMSHFQIMFDLLYRPVRGSAWATVRAMVSQATGTYQTWCSKVTPHQELQQALIPRTWTLWMR